MMFGPLTTEREKKKKKNKLESYPFKLKVKEPYPVKIKPKVMTKDMFPQWARDIVSTSVFCWVSIEMLTDYVLRLK